MSTVEVRLVGGERVLAEGTRDEIEKTLEDAARSGQSRLAWLTDAEAGTPVGVNPSQVTSVRVSSGSG